VAGGILAQPLPPYNPAIIERIRDRVQELPPIADMLAEGKTPEQILDELFAGIPHTLLSKYPVRFECDCSRERTRAALVTLGREELQALLDKEGQALINCRYCHEDYVFDREELEAILATL
jgi:molecular chaperone Hsp33